MKMQSILNTILVLFVVVSIPLAAESTSGREAIFVNRFEKDKNVYLIFNQGLRFEIVSDSWKCENWLPGDLVKIERLYGYSSFDFRIENVQTKQCVYAKYSYIEDEGQDYRLLKKRMDALENRVACLEDLLF